MICIQCGQVVNDGTKFCRFCGSPLTGDVQEQVPQPVPQPQTYSPVPQPVQYQIPVSSAVPGYTGYARPQVEKKPKSKFSLKNPGTILTLLGCILIVAACILPVEYAKTRRITVNKSLLFDSKAWMLHFFAVALILTFLFINMKIGVFVTSLLEVMLCGLDVVALYLDVQDYAPLVRLGSGFTCLVIAMFVLLIGSVWLFISRMRNGS